jgi:hypothetical protein
MAPKVSKPLIVLNSAGPMWKVVQVTVYDH